MESKRTARQSGFELVRIIAMFLIVANHLANHGIFKVTSEDIYALWPEMSPFNQAAGALISCGGRIGVAVFFMLTGYFMVERDKLSPKSAVNFLWRVHFFAAAMFAIVVILRAATGLGADINMPLAARKSFCTPLTIWWFALAYFVLLFLAPSINIFVRSMRGRGAVFLLILYLWYFFYLGGNVSSSYDDYITDPSLIQENLRNVADIVIDGGIGGIEGSTVVDCTSGEWEIIRQGKGELDTNI